MARVYAIISGKGGVGKTTSAVNLGLCMNYLGEDVVIMDANLTTPNVGIHLGAPIVPVTLNHVLSGISNMEDAIYEHESGAKVIPASLSLNELEKINYKKMDDIIKKLKKITNHVLIDCPAGLGEEARIAISACDEIIIVTNPEISAVTDALKTIKLAEEMNRPVIGFILTRYRGNNLEMSVSNIKDMLEIPLLGVIPEDDSVKRSQLMKNAVVHTHPRSKASKGYVSSAKRILGEDVEEAYRAGFFDGFLRAFGLR